MTYKLPDLPANQRWSVRSSFGTYLVVKLQEKRKLFGWKTIAQSTGSIHGGAHEVRQCVDHILNRGYYARLRQQDAETRKKKLAEIPFGETR